MEEQSHEQFDQIWARTMNRLQNLNEQNLKATLRSELSVLEKAAQFKPDNIPILVMLGLAYRQLHNKKAEEIFDHVLNLDPSNEEAVSFKKRDTASKKRLLDYVHQFKALVIEDSSFKDVEEHVKEMRRDFATGS